MSAGATMTLTTHVLAIVCVAMIAAGQILFKVAAGALKSAGTFLDGAVFAAVGAALAIYGAATLLWIVLLQHAPLNRLYAYMALSFVFVAAASWFLFSERIGPGHLAGLGLIVAGLVVIAAS